VAYLRRHPMAECMLDAAELALLREARAQI
jgi:hypothetical protein